MRLVKPLLFSALVFACVIAYGVHHFLTSGVGQGYQSIELEIHSGERLKTVLDNLRAREFIHPIYAKTLYVYARAFQKGNHLKVGVHTVEANLTPDMFFEKLGQTAFVSQEKFTIVEGLKFAEMLEKMEQSGVFDYDIPNGKTSTLGKALGLPFAHAEGMVLPETYFIAPKTKASDFVKRAAKDLNTALMTAWQARAPDLPLKTPYEALILASIVEKETASPKERPLIAGVFVNRLRKGMMLQTDPTVIYGMGDKYKGDIRKKDLTTDTPYNTYTRYGLTPTPIALASIASIKAVMHPQVTDKLYFVAKYDGTGEHYFSKTLVEHNAAVRKYILKK